MYLLPRILSLGCSLALLATTVLAAPVINEIMAHPPGLPENTALEWLEIYNDSATDER